MLGVFIVFHSFSHLEPSFSVFSQLRFGFCLLVSDYVHIESFLSLRNHAKLDFFSSLYGVGCLDFSSPALDRVTLGSLSPLQGHVCFGPRLLLYGCKRLEFSASTLDLLILGSSTLLQSPVRTGLPPLVFGMS